MTTYKLEFLGIEGILVAAVIVLLPFVILWLLVKVIPPWPDAAAIPEHEPPAPGVVVPGRRRRPYSWSDTPPTANTAAATHVSQKLIQFARASGSAKMVWMRPGR